MAHELNQAALDRARDELLSGTASARIVESLMEEFGQARRTAQIYVGRARGYLETGEFKEFRGWIRASVEVMLPYIDPAGKRIEIPGFRSVKIPKFVGEDEADRTRRKEELQSELQDEIDSGYGYPPEQL